MGLKTKLLAGIIVLSAASGGIWWWTQVAAKRAEELRNSTIAAFAEGDWASAKEISRQWTLAEPDSGEAWARHANALAMNSDFEDALAALETVPESFDGFDEVQETRLNLLLRDLHRPFVCREECEKLLARDPGNSTAFGLLIYVDAMLLDLQALNRDVRRAVAASAETPDHYVYLMMLDDFVLMNGAEVTSQWLAESPQSPKLRCANAVHECARMRLLLVKESSDENKTKLQKAIAVRSSLIAEFPDSTILSRSLLLNAMSEGDLQQQAQLLLSAARQMQDEPVFLRAFASAKLQQRDLESAGVTIRAAIEKNPLSFEARSLQSDILRRKGDRDAASRVQEVAIFGSRIRETIALLPSATDATPKLLRQIADYAHQCEDWEIANGLERRLPLGQ